MEKKEWRILRREGGQDLRLFRSYFEWLVNPRNDETIKITLLDGPDSANVVATTPDRKLVAIRQYRFGIHDYTVEVPGGLFDPGEPGQTAAARELREETGYSGEQWRYLGKIPANPVFQTGYIYHYLLTDARLTHQPEPDPAEDIEIVLLPLDEVREGLAQGAFANGHTVNALIMAMPFLERPDS